MALLEWCAGLCIFTGPPELERGCSAAAYQAIP